MQRDRLGCFSATGVLAAILTALVIAGYAYVRGGLLFNPGPLSSQGTRTLGGVTSHAEIGGECESCHTAPWDATRMTDRCVVCHTEIAEQMRDVATVHGTLFDNDPSLECRHCHPEHRGPTAPLTAMEDVPFPHEVVGFSLNVHQLTSAGAPFACDDCHQGNLTTFSLETCDTCHRHMDAVFMSAHTLSFGSACLDCHDGVDRLGQNFDHSQFSFQLTGKHVDVACVQCHVNARSIADFAAAAQDCYACHYSDEPHQGRFGVDCAACHNTSAWTPAQFNGPHHFPLNHGGGATCATCHPSAFTTYTCYGCHEHEEGEMREEHLDEGINNFQNCTECHPNGEKD